MDTTPEYVKMSEKAVEIQALRLPFQDNTHRNLFVDGDFIWHGDDFLVVCEDSCSVTNYRGELDIGSGGICEGAGFAPKMVTWLPRQDQLQEMVGIYTPTDLYEAFVHHGSVFLAGAGVKDGIGWRFWRPNTLEQMFLAFLMDKKYGKRWTGTEWAAHGTMVVITDKLANSGHEVLSDIQRMIGNAMSRIIDEKEKLE